MNPKLSILALATLSLAGCGHGLSASASSKHDNSSKIDLSRGVERRTTASVSNKTTVSVPEAPLAVEAIQGLDMAKLDPEHQAAARAVHEAASSVIGWPSGCLWLPGMPPCKKNREYARREAANVIFANSVLSAVSQDLPAGVRLSYPSAAREALAKAFLALKPADLRAMQQQAEHQAESQHLDLDETGTASVKFFLGAGVFEGGAGWSWTQNNVPWFGGGKLSGRDVTVALDHSRDEGASKVQNATISTSTGTSQSNGGDASVK